MTERIDQPTPEPAKPASPPITRRKAAIRIGVLVFGVVLPLVTTLTPTEARAQATDGS
jgi:hypothetical protein